jgi:hypothetical protein
MQFTEVEHKYVVGDRFDRDDFARRVEALGPGRRSTLRVRDRYFLTEDGRRHGYILRHRHDLELHELTLKSFADDARVRQEVNLALAPIDQDRTVDAFVAALRPVWHGALWKDLDVWYFPDCEVVHYVATADGRRLACVEFEATGQSSVHDALAVVARYEAATGFSGAVREIASLPALLWPGVLPGRRLDA